MTILALEFSSAQRSVAVASNESVLSQAAETGGRGMAAFALIEKALAGASIEREQIQAIAVGLGPGSYTGIRAAIALAEGWNLARKVALTGASSVAAIVVQAQSEKIYAPVTVVVDAQRGEFYCATYDITATGWTEQAPLKILPPSGVLELSRNRVVIGPEAPQFPAGRLVFPSAAAVAKLAAAGPDFTPDKPLEPIYLRQTDFTKAKAAGINTQP
ncbi:MAG: tRNA (adenosine(37)-N6)-threonylcarbamoyltransferase complex dimerization subunit type 1 TsaB [Limisphaerales bacterium]